MEKPNLRFAIKVNNPTDEISEILKEVSPIKLSDKEYVFVYKDADQDIYDELADIGTEEQSFETTVSFGLLNDNDKQFYPSDALTESIRKQLDENGSLGIETLSMISIDEIEDILNKEKKKIIYDFYGGTEKVEETPNDNAVENKSDEEKSQNVTPQEPKEDNFQEKEAIPTNNNEDVDSANKEENISENNFAEDPLKVLANKIIDSHCVIEFPKYDDRLSEQLKPVLAQVETDSSLAKQKAVAKVYQVLQDKQPLFEKIFEDKFSDNQKKHDGIIATLLDNEKIQKDKVTESNQKEYLAARDQFIESQKPALIAKFDSEHKSDFDNNLKQEKNVITQKTQEQIDEENHNFDTFKADEEDKFLEKQFLNVDVSDILNELNERIESNLTKIQNAANHFVDQTKIVAKKALDQRDEYKRKYEEAEKVSKTLNATFEPRVETEVKERLAEQTSDMKKRVNAALEGETQARKEMQKMGQDHIVELKAQAHKYNATIKKIRNEDDEDKRIALEKQESNYEEKISDMNKKHDEELSSKNNQIDQLQNDLNKANQETLGLQRTIDQLKSQNQLKTSLPKEAETQSQSSKSTFKNWLIGILALTTVGGFCYGLGKSQVPTQTTSTVTATNSTVATENNSSNSQAPYTKGQKVEYHDPKTNKDYQVTINNVSGNTSTGNYTDDKGITHTVTFTND